MREGSSGPTSLSADAALPTLGANPCPHPWPDHSLVEGNWFSQQQQQHHRQQQPKPGLLSDMHPGTSVAPVGTGWGPDRNPWPQNWGAGKPGMVPELSATGPTSGKEALQGPDVRPLTWIGVIQSGAMMGSATADLAAGPAGHWAQCEQSLAPVCLSKLGDIRRSDAGEQSAQPAGRSMVSTHRSDKGAAPQVTGMQSPLHPPWPKACKWHPSQQHAGATLQPQGMPYRALKGLPALAVPQVMLILTARQTDSRGLPA